MQVTDQSLWLTQAHFPLHLFFLLMIMQIVILRGITTSCFTLPLLSSVVLVDTNHPTSQEKLKIYSFKALLCLF